MSWAQAAPGSFRAAPCSAGMPDQAADHDCTCMGCRRGPDDVAWTMSSGKVPVQYIGILKSFGSPRKTTADRWRCSFFFWMVVRRRRYSQSVVAQNWKQLIATLPFAGSNDCGELYPYCGNARRGTRSVGDVGVPQRPRCVQSADRPAGAFPFNSPFSSVLELGTAATQGQTGHWG